MARTEGQRLLHEWLKERRLLQKDLATRLRRTGATVSVWLSGKKRPDVVSLAVLEDVTGIPPRAWAQKPNGSKRIGRVT